MSVCTVTDYSLINKNVIDQPSTVIFHQQSMIFVTDEFQVMCSGAPTNKFSKIAKEMPAFTITFYFLFIILKFDLYLGYFASFIPVCTHSHTTTNFPLSRRMPVVNILIFNLWTNDQILDNCFNSSVLKWCYNFRGFELVIQFWC